VSDGRGLSYYSDAGVGPPQAGCPRMAGPRRALDRQLWFPYDLAGTTGMRFSTDRYAAAQIDFLSLLVRRTHVPAVRVARSKTINPQVDTAGIGAMPSQESGMPFSLMSCAPCATARCRNCRALDCYCSPRLP